MSPATGSPEAGDTALEEEVRRLIAMALEEDVGTGDWTTLWTVPADQGTEARIAAKQSLVFSGELPARAAFLRVDPGLVVDTLVPEGEVVEAGTTLLTVRGSARAILTAERTALNFLARLSGIATLTRAFVERVAGTECRIIDTRKTTPGWRHLEKAAVRTGGGMNHRMGLHDMVLIKDNHIAASGGVGQAVARVRARNEARLPVEVEVASMEQLEELRGEDVDRILLDNMEAPLLEEAVGRVRSWPDPRPELEASGNMTLDRVRLVAETGVDFISVGSLTHSAPAADLSLRLESPPASAEPDGGEDGR